MTKVFRLILVLWTFWAGNTYVFSQLPSPVSNDTVLLIWILALFMVTFLGAMIIKD